MTIRALKVLLPALLVAACSRAPASSANQTPPSGGYKPSPLVAWLECVECTEEQLTAVADLRDAAVPELKSVLLTGPPRARLDGQRDHLQKRYQTLKDYERLNPDQRVPFTQEDYVRLYLAKYVLLNRMRSARALGAIGTPAAKDALNQARQLPDLPDDLRREIDAALVARPR